jgi:hypothetical protein
MAMNFQQPIGEQIQKMDIQGKVGETVDAAKEAAAGAYGNFSETVANTKESVTNALDEFSGKSVGEAGQDFLQTNTIIAKFVFLILVVIGFMFLLNLGVLIMGYFTSPPSSPFIISGLINGNNSAIIPQDPKNKTSVLVKRSNNENTGIEFTWSVWLQITDIAYSNGMQYQHIFSKGDQTWDTTSGVAKVNNGPGLYLDSCSNMLHVVMSTVNPANAYETVDVSNVPLNKWFNCMIRMENKVMDVYINGTVASRLIMQNVPKQNYNDVLVCQHGGFTGLLADLRYLDHSLSVMDINSIIVAGPNTNSAGLGASYSSLGYSYYLSNLWYASKT